MKFKRPFLFLLALSFIVFSVFSFQDRVYSTADTTTGIPLESNPVNIAINPLTNEAVVANEKSDSVSVVNLDIHEVIATIPVGKAPKGVAIDKELNIAIVTNAKDNTVILIDLYTNEAVTTIPVGKNPQGVAVNQNTHTALVANHKDNSVSVIDLMTYGAIGTIAVGKKPVDVAIDPGLSLALVVNEGKKKKDYNVSVIDLNTYEGTVTVGKKPQAIDINPETHLAAVANEKDNTITIIDIQTWQTRTIPVEKHPIDIAINPLDNRALVICNEPVKGSGDRTLLLINLNTDTIVKEYSINKKSKAVAVNNFTNIAGVVDDKTDSLTLIQLPNPIPEINTIDPDTVLRGSTDTLINIQGNKFITSSLAYLNSEALTTTFINNHNIQALIHAEMLLEAGTYPVTVTNPAPEGGISNSVNLQINNPIPTISALAPLEVMAGIPGLTLTVYGTGFFDDTIVYINGISRPFTLISQTKLQLELTASDLEVGAYLKITASNPPPGGGLSEPATFTVLNPIPTLSSIDPTTIIARSPEFTLTLTGDNFVKTSIANFNNQQFPITYISKTQIEATLPSGAIEAPGDYPVTVINPAPGGGESAPLTFTVKPPIEIKITSPLDGETINRAKIMVKGTIKSDTKDIGITVNGILAEIMGNEWIANDVPLTIGTNTITAVATDFYGNTDTKTITIYTNDITQYVSLTANITSGIPPLKTYFSVSTSIPNSVSTYEMDYEGDGVIDYTGATFEDISFTYTTEGIYYPTVTVTDSEGNIYSDTIAITVLNKEELDTLLRAKWEGMKEALKIKDIEKALSYFDIESRDRYRAIFEALKDKMPAILDTFVEFNFVEFYEYTIEYEIVANENGVLYSYPITFIRGEDGIWRFRDF